MTKAFVFAGNETVGNMVADRLCGAGWQRVGDAGAADAVITYFTTQTALEDAYFGDNGIVQGARKGTQIIDLSCTTPTFARELNAMACVADLVAVEAPLVVTDVAVPDAFAVRENLGCFVGGEEDCVEAAREVLDLLVKGRNTQYISDQLFIAQGTAKTHIYNIYRKIGIHTKMELLDAFDAFCHERGLAQKDDRGE